MKKLNKIFKYKERRNVFFQEQIDKTAILFWDSEYASSTLSLAMRSCGKVGGEDK